MCASERAPFHVHVLGAKLERTREHAAAIELRAGELPALPHRTAGDDGRQPAAGQRTLDVHVRDAVEAELHHVGVPNAIACGNELRHGAAHDGFTQPGRLEGRHPRHQIKSASPTGVEEALVLAEFRNVD
jgi:hypothetical protein